MAKAAMGAAMTTVVSVKDRKTVITFPTS